MELTVTAETLGQALALCMKVIPKDPVSAAYSVVGIKADETGTHVFGGDGQIYIRVEVEAEVGSHGSVSLLPANLVKLLKTLPGKEKVQLNVKDKTLEVTAQSFEGYSLLTSSLNAVSVPNVKKIPGCTPTSIDVAVNSVKTAADDLDMAEEEVVQVLIESGKLTVHATDRYRIVACSTPVNLLKKAGAAVVRLKALELLRGHDLTGIGVDATNKKLVLNAGKVLVVTNLLDNKFLPVENILKTSPLSESKVDGTDFKEKLVRIEAVLDPAWPVVLDFEGKVLSLLTPEGSASGKGKETLLLKTASVTPTTLGINAKYLAAAIKSKDVTLGWSGPTSAIYVTCVEKTTTTTSVIMPVKL